MKVIKNHEDYSVTSDGRVYSHINDVWLKDTAGSSGYNQVKLRGRNKMVHILVAIAHIPNPRNLPVVNHIDEDKTNNDVSNLEWCTHRHNASHTFAKTYTFIKNNNTIHVHNLASFCRRHKLRTSNMYQVAKGTRRSAHGYTTPVVGIT